MGLLRWTGLAAAGLVVAGLAGRAAAGEGDGMEGPAPQPAAPAAKPAPVAGDDVLVLKDGREIRGRITAEDDQGYAVRVGGSVRVYDKKEVTSVRRGAPAPDAGAPGSDGASPAPGAPAGKPGAEPGKRARKKGEMPEERPLSPEAETWAASCIDRLGSPDPAIQRSAAEALRALGPAVAPLLEKAAAEAGPDRKPALDRVLASVKKGPPNQGPGGAMPGRPPRPGMDGPMERIRNDLGLDDEQAKKVGVAVAEYSRSLREAYRDVRDGVLTYEEAAEVRPKAEARLHKDLDGTLSAEQVQKLDSILDEMVKRAAGKGQEPPKKAPPPPEKKPGDS